MKHASRSAGSETKDPHEVGGLEERAYPDAGVVEFIGAGLRKLVQLRGGYPLAGTLKELYRAEAHRFDALTTALRELLSRMPRPPISAWIDRGGENLESTETLTLYVVARPGELDTLTDYLNDRLADLERKQDVHIAVHGLMPCELKTLHRSLLTTPNPVVLLGGVSPVALLERSRSTGSKIGFLMPDFQKVQLGSQGS
jgi:hypothetical protein